MFPPLGAHLHGRGLLLVERQLPREGRRSERRERGQDEPDGGVLVGAGARDDVEAHHLAGGRRVGGLEVDARRAARNGSSGATFSM